MSKRIRTLVIVAVAVVALLAASLAVAFLLPQETEEGDDASTQNDTITVLDRSKDSEGNTASSPVRKVEIQTEQQTYTMEPNADGDLAVVGYEDLLVAANRTENLASTLATVTAERLVAENPENPADYGLDTPRGVATVTYHDDSTAVLEVGDEDPLGEGVYFRLQGEPAVYLVDQEFADTVFQDPVYYISTTLISAPSVRDDDTGGEAILRDMKLTGSLREGQPLSFRRTTTSDSAETQLFTYVITSPYMRSFNDSMLQSLLTNATTLTATVAVVAHPTDEQLTEYGFDDPYSVAEFNLAVLQGGSDSSEDTEEEETVFYNIQAHTVVIGSKAEDGSYYIRVDDYPSIYKASASSLPWAEAVYSNSVSTSLFTKNITDVSSVIVKTEGEETRFELTHYPEAETANEQLAVTCGGETYPTDEFRSLYQVLMLVKRSDVSDAEPQGDPVAQLIVEPTEDGGSSITASFYANSGSTYLCQLQDGDTFLVSASSVEGFLKQVDNYLAGEKVIVSLA